MTKDYKILIFLFIAFLFSSNVKAQTNLKDTATVPYWLDMMQDHSISIHKTKRAFDVYWKNRTIEKGCGYKPFMRWFTSMEGKVNAFGLIPDPQIAIDEYNKFVNLYGVGNNQYQRGGVGGSGATCNTSGDWKELGPYGLPTNQPGQPNGNGRVNGIGFHPTDSNTFWVGSPQGGVWKTINGGKNWTTNTDGLPTLGVSDIAVNPSNASILYIGTGDRDGGDAAGLGVYKSTNGGVTWVASNTGMGNRTVSKVIIDPSTNTRVIAAVNGGIYRSTNSGGSWTQTFSGGNFKDIVFHPTNSNIVYAARYGNNLAYFYKSTNNGVSWTRITSGLPSNGYRGTIAVSKALPNLVYFLITNQRTFKGMYVSYNSGTNFKTQSTTPNVMDYTAPFTSTTAGQAWYDLDIAANPKNPNEVYVCGVNVFRSTDTGKTWVINAHWVGSGGVPAVHADHHVMEFHPITNDLYTGNDGGIHKTSNNGTTYEELTSDLRVAQIYRTAQARTNKDWVISGYQDNGTGMMRGNKDWYTVMGGDGMDCQIDPTDTKWAYSDLYYGDVRRYTNGFFSGQIAKNGIKGINEQGAWVTSFILKEGTPSTMFIGYDNVWRSTNVQAATASVAWTKVSAFSNSADIHYLENCISAPNTMYVSKKDGYMYKSTNVNAGTPTWTQCARPTGTYPRWIETDPGNANTVYIAQSNNIYKSTNGGTSWTDISGNLPNSVIHCIKYDSSAGMEAIYVGMSVGVYFKDSTMTNWVLFNKNLPKTSEITDLDIYYDPAFPECSHITASTYGRGTWKSYLYPSASRKPKPKFSAAETNVVISCGTNSTILYNESCDFPTRFLWKVTPAVTYINGTDSCSENPEIRFNTAGFYTVKLVADNCNGIDSTEKKGYITVLDSVLSATCIPTFTNKVSTVGIINVSLSGHSRSSSASNVASYTDYSCTDIIKLLPSTNYNLVATLTNVNASGLKAYMDYNNDGDFLDANETLGTVATGTGARTLKFTTIASPPKGIPLRLRVIDRYASTTILPCGGSYSYGEAEDYAVYFEPTNVIIARVGGLDSICPGTIVNIVDSATSSASSYTWNFGTNATPSTATGPGPHQVKFGSLGYQSVSVTSNGIAYTKDSIVFVKPGPNLKEGILYGSLPSCAGDSVAIWASDSNNTRPSYQWYKNGTLVSGKTDTLLTFGNISISDTGNYYLIANSNGCRDTSVTRTVMANPAPVAAFGITTDTMQCLGGNSFAFNNTSSLSSGTMTHNWDFGDGMSSSATSPTHSYGSASTYVIKLVTTSASGCKDSFTRTVYVTSGPIANFTIADSTICEGQGGFSFTNTSTGGGTYSWSFGDGTGVSTSNASRTYSTPNTYSVKLVATAGGCSDSISMNVYYYAKPNAGFTINKDTQCLAINDYLLTDTSKVSGGATLSRLWYFGDGNTSTLSASSHTYSSIGTRTVKLISTSSVGCIDSISKQVVTNASPISSFTVNDTTQCINNNSFSFTNASTGATSYNWNYGDFTFATSINGSRFYSNSGTYLVSLISEISGCKDTSTAKVYVHELPLIGFTIDNDSQCFSTNVFNMVDTSKIGLGTLSRLWDFGDMSTSILKSPSHSYSSDDVFTIRLVVTSSNGCIDSLSKQVLTSPTPDANFGVNDSTQCLNDNYFVFSNTSSITNGFMRFEWDFGDDSTSIAANGTHTYLKPGTYSVQLRVYSLSGGCVDSISRDIRVNPSPVSSFTVNNDTQCFVGHNFLITNSSSITAGSYLDSFFFGDTYYSDAKNPAHTYLTEGAYTILHRMTSDQGCMDSSKIEVELNPTPNTSFGIGDTGQCFRGHSFVLTNNSSIKSGSFSNYWDLGDGSSSRTAAFAQSYLNPGNYTIKLVTQSNKNCFDSVTQFVLVHPETSIGFTIDRDTQCFTGHLFSFSDTSALSKGTYTRLWRLGDTDTSTAATLGKIYGVQNNYKVKLITVTDMDCQDSIEKEVVLLHSTVASFGINDNTQCKDGNNFMFTNNSTNTGGALVQKWDFGDGSGSSLKDPSHSYNLDSIRTVTLMSSVVGGCKDTVAMDVEIYPMPLVNFIIADSLQCLNGNTMNFTDNSSIRYGNLLVHDWGFGDNTGINSLNANHIYAAFGNFTVTKTVQSGVGCIDSFKSILEIYESPFVDYMVNKDSQCFVGNDFVFTNTSNIGTGTLQYTWYFGDNSDSALTRDAQHTYLLEQGFTVKLNVESNKGCTDSIEQNMVVMPNPVASFSITDSSQCLITNSFQFNNTTVVSSGTFSSVWDFGDGNTSNLKNPVNHSYAVDNAQTVKMTITTGFGCTDNDSKDLIVHPMPQSSFNVNSIEQCLIGNVFSLTDNSKLTRGTIDGRDWDFGDGSNSMNTLLESHTFLATGVYSLKLNVTSNEGCLDDSIINVTVNSHPMTDFTTQNECLGDSVGFTYTGSADATSYFWSFGDGGISSNQDPKRLYNSAGNYDVRLIATNGTGCKDTMARVDAVEVYPKPVAAFTSSKISSSGTSSTMSYLDASTDATQWIWEFGDGNVSGMQNPQHIFSDTGTYTTLLIAENNYGCIDSTTETKFVFPDFVYHLPTGFTPNEDGLNDVWRGEGLAYTNKFELKIYNRWGEIVFETNDPLTNWDGTFIGKPLMNGVYVYVVDIEDLNHDTHHLSGDITILR